MTKKFAAAVLLVVSLTLGASACSTSDVKQSKFQSELKDKSKLTDKQATCVTDAIYKQFSQKDINKLYTADTDADLPTGMGDKFTAIITKCVAG